MPPGTGSASLGDDLDKLSWLASHLDDLQVRLGGAMPYGDPADSQEARRLGLRRDTLARLMMGLAGLRLLGTFTADQWAQAKADGLRWGYDLTPEQQSSEAWRMATREVPEGRLREVVVKLGRTEERSFTPPGGTAVTIPPVPALRLTLDGAPVGELFLAPPWPAPPAPAASTP